MHPRGRLQGEGGFTLLELLVVLAMVSMLAGLVGPAAVRAVEGAETRALHRRLVAVVEALPLEAYRSGQPLALNATELRARLGPAAKDAQLRLQQPLAYSAEGVARGAQLSLVDARGGERVWVVQPVSGKVEPAPP
jgi:prepilin-type N-terminal cleavage/methylation domain-containing protein